MKKTILLILLFVSMAVCSSARGKGGNPYYKTGYLGSVGLHIGGINAYFSELGFTTIHGKTFGNRVFLGGGIGLGVPFDSYDDNSCMTVPIFIDAKYSALDQRVSLFRRIRHLMCKGGFSAQNVFGRPFVRLHAFLGQMALW